MSFVVESQFLDNTTTLAEFQGIVTNDVVPNLSGLEAVDVPDPVCKNENLTESMPSLMPTMTHDKTINLVNRLVKQHFKGSCEVHALCIPTYNYTYS